MILRHTLHVIADAKALCSTLQSSGSIQMKAVALQYPPTPSLFPLSYISYIKLAKTSASRGLRKINPSAQYQKPIRSFTLKAAHACVSNRSTKCLIYMGCCMHCNLHNQHTHQSSKDDLCLFLSFTEILLLHNGKIFPLNPTVTVK